MNLNLYDPLDHQYVRDGIRALPYLWVVSYDNTPEINHLYADYFSKQFAFKHTAYESRKSKDVMFFSEHLELPNLDDWDPIRFKLLRFVDKNQVVYV